MAIGSGKTLALAAAVLAVGVFFNAHALAEWDPSWRTALEETCAKSNDAMALSVQELTALIGRCNELERKIQGEEESVGKVYLKRLALCRNLYSYVLDYKKATASSAAPSTP